MKLNVNVWSAGYLICEPCERSVVLSMQPVLSWEAVTSVCAQLWTWHKASLLWGLLWGFLWSKKWMFVEWMNDHSPLPLVPSTDREHLVFPLLPGFSTGLDFSEDFVFLWLHWEATCFYVAIYSPIYVWPLMWQLIRISWKFLTFFIWSPLSSHGWSPHCRPSLWRFFLSSSVEGLAVAPPPHFRPKISQTGQCARVRQWRQRASTWTFRMVFIL